MTSSSATPKTAAIVLAAGKGTRMKSKLPKVLHEVLGEPLCAWPIRAALAAGADPVVVVVGHERERVEAALTSRFGDKVRCVVQEEQKGTGHAARVGMSALKDAEGAVLILYGDTPLIRTENLLALRRLVKTDRDAEPLAMWVCRLEDPAGYGRIVRDDHGAVVRIVEHKDAGDAERQIKEVNPGMYCARADFLRKALDALKADNAQGELYLTDIVEAAVEEAGDVPTLNVAVEETLGVNDRRQLAVADQVLAERTRQELMKEGVTILDPTTTRIEASVAIAPDTILEPGVVLRGTTRIGSDVTVGVGCVLTDSIVEDGATLHPYSVLEEAHVGPACQVGPYARLRPAARLEKGAKVGNFVEVKKATLGEGAKANHLAYIGDAEIGAHSNIGAGTITCNYDGAAKHQTVLGEGVFVGSNATLVAPLTLNKGAYVAAGSTVSRDVPEDALAVGRARQENKEGYAARIRERNEKRKAAQKAQKGS
jgi:bifunctional UDP-N-acetylglucosamine pyrophosphorylase/glucosamine-1-phosphate N-acetyltransferase